MEFKYIDIVKFVIFGVNMCGKGKVDLFNILLFVWVCGVLVLLIVW